MAATASNTTVPLPPETLELIARHTLRGRLPSLRLACSQFAFAADPCVTFLSVKADQWPHAPPAVGSRLQHVQCMSAVPTSPAHWHQLFQLSAQLPKLSHLRLPDTSSSTTGSDSNPLPTMPTFSAASLSSLTRLDLATAGSALSGLQPPEGVQLPGLKAASFDDVKGLWRIACFAPNLEQLYCDRLVMCSDDQPVLHECTHYASTNVMIVSISEEEPDDLMAAEFSKAFPNLQVLTNAPAFCTLQWQDEDHPGPIEDVDSADVLQHCTSLRAIKALGTFVGCSLQQLQQLLQLTRLSLHNPLLFYNHVGQGPFEGIGQLTQLQHVRLTCSENLSSQLAQQLAALPNLQTLVLPAELLMAHWQRAKLLEVASSSSLTCLEFLETWHDMVLDRYWDALGDGEDEFRFAVDAAYEKQKAQQQQMQAQQQGQEQPSGRKLHTPEQRGRQDHDTHRAEENWLAKQWWQSYGSRGVWGIYGAAGEW